MKAIVQPRYGSPDVLEVADVERPSPGEGQVLIRVGAAGVNTSDWHLMRGIPYFVRTFWGLRRPKQEVIGIDLAGRVAEAGPGVEGLRPGDEVFGWGSGAFAEYACATEQDLLPIPPDHPPRECVALGDSAMTALDAVRDQARVESGQEVVVTGASGGVGTYAVQIAKARGARVTAVCSGGNADLVRSIGADEVVDYTREDFTGEAGRYDAILDTVSTAPLSACRRALRPGGRYVLIGSRKVGRWLGLGRQLRALTMSPFGSRRMRVFVATRNAKDLSTLRDMLVAGELRPVIERGYPLAEVPDALRHQGGGHVRGKLVVDVG